MIPIHLHHRAWQALAYAGGVFYVSYTLTNLYAHALHQTAPLSNVATMLDLSIPFIAPMIGPYALSVPLFVVSFFVIKPEQLSALTHRLIFTSIFSAFIFYQYPLVFSFERTNFYAWGVDWAWAYRLLSILDKPFNQLPSLHVGFAVVIFLSLYDTLKAKSTYAVIGLFLLCLGIILSTLLTYQHHVVDVLAGLLCAVAIYYLDDYLRRHYTDDIKSCIVKYITIALLWFLLLHTLPVILGFDFILIYHIIGLYGCVSFIMVACCYHIYRYDNPVNMLCRVFTKHQGKLSIISLILFSPLMMIYYLMWYISKKQGFFYQQKTPIIINTNLSIMVTGRLDNLGIATMTLSEYRHIIYVDVATELSANLPKPIDAKVDYMYIPILDLADFHHRHLPMLLQQCQLIQNKMNADIPTLIICQCAMGRSRSVGMMAYLLGFLGGYSANAIRQWIDQYCPNHHAQRYLTDDLLIPLTHHTKQGQT